MNMTTASTNLPQYANANWRKRPDDQRFVSLLELQAHFRARKARQNARVISTHQISAVPVEDETSLGNVMLRGCNGADYVPTNWAFSQVCQRAGAPAGYLASLPAPLTADLINYGLKFERPVEDIGVLYERSKGDAVGSLQAATGPNYGRIWNADLIDELVDRVGDGITGAWRVPGEFGRRVEVTKANTTLFASDRDLFVFLADEENRITIPNRRDGKSGSLARGFWISNSEVGAKTLILGAFLFDYVCCNRLVWGGENYQEIRIRHTPKAPDRWLEEVTPALKAYAEASAKPFEDAIKEAQKTKVDKVQEFLKNRYGKKLSESIQRVFEKEEGRPIETRWDVATGVTALARNLPHQDARVDMERSAGELIIPAKAAEKLILPA